MHVSIWLLMNSKCKKKCLFAFVIQNGDIFVDLLVFIVLASSFLSFITGPWQTCSRTCGAGSQRRSVKCQVLLSFSQTVADLPDDECDGVKPAASRPCYRKPCSGRHGDGQDGSQEEDEEETYDREELHDWEYDGFTECSESCGGGRGRQRCRNLLFPSLKSCIVKSF